MEPGPSEIMEAIVGCLLPPACREEVMGDLRERHQRSASWLAEAMHVVPAVIYSRICRTMDAVVTLMMLLGMFTAFVFAAWSIGRELLFDDRGFIRLMIPSAICIAVIVLGDAYSDTQNRRALKPLFGPLVGLVVAGISQSVLAQWALPPLIWVWGSGISLLLLSILRITFPPIADQPQAARVPAFWQKLEIAGPPLSVRTALLSFAVVLLILVYFSAR